MISLSQRRLLPVGILFVFLLIFCGQNTRSDAADPLTGLSASSSTDLPSSFSVTLQTRTAHYHPGSTIHVTVKNQSNKTIFFADHQTDCTVLRVERRVADVWKPIAPCQLEMMTRMHSLHAGEFLHVLLPTSDQWLIGQYRARLDYHVQSEAGIERPTTVSSNRFYVI